MSPRVQGFVMPWLVVAGLFLAWELLVLATGLPPFVLPAPTAVFAALGEFSGPIMHHALHTLGTTLAGFALSVWWAASPSASRWEARRWPTARSFRS